MTIPIPSLSYSGPYFNPDGSASAQGLRLLRDLNELIDRTGGILSDGVSRASVTATGGATDTLDDWMASLAAVIVIVADGDKGDVVVSASGATWTIDANAVSDTKLRDSTGLSVIGRSANSSGDPADIVAANDAEVLRRSGTSIGFGTVATAGIANDAVTDGKLRDSAALSVIGRSANSTGDPADIAAGSDGHVLRRSGTALGFGTIVAAGIADAVITYAKMATAAIATAAEFWANTASKLLDTAGVWAAADPVTITFSTTQTLDFSTFINGVITLTNNTTLQTPTNLKKGQCGCIELIQDGTGSRTMNSSNSAFIWAGGTEGVLSTAASTRDLLFYQILDDNKVYLSLVKAVS